VILSAAPLRHAIKCGPLAMPNCLEGAAAKLETARTKPPTGTNNDSPGEPAIHPGNE
jgi:hypothetical protein